MHDCAATGLYVGDMGSFSLVAGCNIIRNGFGTRVPTRAHEAIDSIDAAMDSEHPTRSTGTMVPPGHSGIYVESTGAVIVNSLMAGNSLTGLSVVRGGSAKLKDCDILENGSEPLTIEEANDLVFEAGMVALLRGGVDDLGGNTLGRAVSNPLQLDCARGRFRASVSERVSLGHLKMADL